MSASYMLKAPARCLVPVAADEESHSFLTGTCMNPTRGKNEIRLLRYYEEDDDLECAAVYEHPQEITCLCSHARDASLVATAYKTTEGGPTRHAATIWRLPSMPGSRASGHTQDDSDSVPKPLERVADVPMPPGAARVLYVHWFPATDGSEGSAGSTSTTNNLLAVSESHIRVWSLQADGSLSLSREMSTSDVEHVGGAAWDPHHSHEVAVASDCAIHIWDVRSGDCVRSIGAAVPPGCVVRALSYNANKPWHLASGGDDYRVKVWDLRRLATPVKILDGHTHWVTAVAFNPFHDQLVLSGGTDARVNLWRVSSISSAPLLELGGDDDDDGAGGGGGGGRKETKLAPDAALKSHEDHDDSVYAACWSARNAWVYASISYTGKVVVCNVPSTEKYKILL